MRNCQPSRGRQHTILPKFEKLHEIEKILGHCKASYRITNFSNFVIWSETGQNYLYTGHHFVDDSRGWICHQKMVPHKYEFKYY